MRVENQYDVVILGAGLAGLSLVRHLLLETDKTILLLEKRSEIPPPRQKVGESLVQMAGYYFSKVLDLEEHLLHEHLMKYNLRFYWKSGGCDNHGGDRCDESCDESCNNSRFEDFSQLYIRPFSNIASYQLDRNVLEGELLRLNQENSRFTFQAGISGLDVELATEGSHSVRFKAGEEFLVTARWVVDTTGRGRFLARRKGMTRPNTIDHGAFFWWVDGLVNIEKLTDSSPRQIRLNPNRRHTGHLPLWQATNHFMGEGLWFWVIPLKGKTSLGLVFDNAVVSHRDVFSVEKATEWVCREFPLFARDLPHRKVLDFGGYKSYSYDCTQTIDPTRWALSGEAGRFTDPLYSPGSDLIALYNTLIVDAICTEDDSELASKCQLYEHLMRSIYAAYVPAYATSYDALGDQEVFALKYGWELTIYFAGYVFPFINDLFTDRRFVLSFMRLFSRLGPLNRDLQAFLSEFYQWKKTVQGVQGAPREPIFFDLTEIAALRQAEKTFYCIGVTVEEARRIFDEQVQNLEELARFIVSHVTSVVLENAGVLTNRDFVESIDLKKIQFDPEAMRQHYAQCQADGALCQSEGVPAGESLAEGSTAEGSTADGRLYDWLFDPFIFECFRTPVAPPGADAEEPALVPVQPQEL
jgi:flavin-dependent dehydrogenase